MSRRLRTVTTAIAFCAFAIIVLCGTGAAVTTPRQNSGTAEPVVVRPGDGRVDGRRISPYESGWRTFRIARDGRRTPLAVWHDTVTVIQADSGAVLRRVQRIVPAKGPVTVLLNEAERDTLLPVRTTATRGESEPFIDLRFDGKRVTGRRPFLPRHGTAAESVPVQIDLELPEVLYDWRWWGLLVAAQPLDRGYASRFLTFATESEVESFLMWITARVTGEERVGDVPCWRVEVEAGAPWTLWIAKLGDHAPVQQIRIAQPNGDVVAWEPFAEAGAR